VDSITQYGTFAEAEEGGAACGTSEGDLTQLDAEEAHAPVPSPRRSHAAAAGGGGAEGSAEGGAEGGAERVVEVEAAPAEAVRAVSEEEKAEAISEAAAAVVRFSSFARRLGDRDAVCDRTAALGLLPELGDHSARLERTAVALAAATRCSAQSHALLTALQRLPAARGARQCACDSLAEQLAAGTAASGALAVSLEAHAAGLMLTAVQGALCGPAPRAREQLRRLSSPQVEAASAILQAAAAKASPPFRAALAAAADRIMATGGALGRLKRLLPQEVLLQEAAVAPEATRGASDADGSADGATGSVSPAARSPGDTSTTRPTKVGPPLFDPSSEASEASEALTPPPPEPATRAPTPASATPAAFEATKLDSEIAEQRRQLETEREALRARRLSRSCRHSHSGASFSPDSLRTSPSAAGSSPSVAGASPAFPASPACSRSGSSPCGLGAERTPSALTAASEAATIEAAAAPAVCSPASVVYSIAGHPLYDAPPASPARRSDSRASVSSAEENRPANGSRHRYSAAEATTVPAKVAEFEALASPSQSPSLRSPRDPSPADVDSSAHGSSPRRVSGYRLAANALVEQRVRRARLCNSHSPETQDEEAEELGV